MLLAGEGMRSIESGKEQMPDFGQETPAPTQHSLALEETNRYSVKQRKERKSIFFVCLYPSKD